MYLDSNIWLAQRFVCRKVLSNKMNDKPKLLIVADTYYPKLDGTLIFVEEFIKRTKDDFQLSQLVPDLGLHKGKNVTYLDTYKKIQLSGYPSIKFSFSNRKKIRNAVKNSDIVFVQGPGLASYWAIYYGKKYAKKTYFYLHTITWELFAKFLPPLFNKMFFNFIKNFSVKSYNRCTEVLVPYHGLKDQLTHSGVHTKISVARLGVDIDRFQPTKNKQKSKIKLGLDPNKTVIGYVGRISKEKNVQTLREAFLKLSAKENIFLLMVGDGTDEQKKKFEEITNCKITGFVRGVQGYLKAMDIFVMPSLTETTSLATLEAMASGLPVISTKVGFIKNYIVKGHNGIFFPRNSATMLSIKIEKLIHNQDMIKKLSVNARKTVAYSFSWERSINKIKRLLLND
jgi:glycosyltransferase involved in cell wall biosynthesis